MKESEVQPPREDNWKKYPYLYNQCKNLSFECECGKKYVSFPGLYLHFQRKHGQKISTKLMHESCQAVTVGSRTTYKYHYNLGNEKKDEKNLQPLFQGERTHASFVLSRFIEDSTQMLASQFGIPNRKDARNFVEHVISRFQNYMASEKELKNLRYDWAQVLSTAPNYLNGFIADFTGSGSNQYWDVCRILHCLCAWLNQQGYSSLVVVYENGPNVIV